MEELGEKLGAMALHGGGDPPVTAGDLIQIAAERMRGQQARRRDRYRFHHNQPSPAARSRFLVGDEVLGGQVVFDQGGLMRGRDDPAGQFCWADPERAEQRRERAHLAGLATSAVGSSPGTACLLITVISTTPVCAAVQEA